MAKKTSYNGNELLKRSNVPIKWTQERVEEFARCKASPIYFIENYVKIIHPDRGVLPFVLRDYQREAIDLIHSNRFVALNWARQIGKSQVIAAYITWFCIFNDAKTVILAANKQEASKEVLSRIKISFMYLPDFLQQGVTRWNEADIAFENKSRVLAEATTGNTGRGKSASIVYGDECAFVERWQEFWDSVNPTISAGTDTKFLLSSTPRGLNHWWKIVEDARHGRGRFKLIEAKWDRVPGRDKNWKENEIKDTSEELFAQNHELEFLGSSGTLISGNKLKQLFAAPVIELNKEFNIRRFEAPNKTSQYIITVDVSRGSGIDASAFSVLDITQAPFKQVAVMNNDSLFSHELAEIVFAWAKQYNEAFVLVENNDIGQEVANLIMNDYEYEKLIFSKTDGRNGITLSFGGAKTLPGIRTTVRSKRIGCSTLKNLIETNQLIVQDQDTIFELSNFIKRKNSYEADPNVIGCHDDIVMTLVLFAYLTDQIIFKELTSVVFNKKTRVHEEQSYLPDLSKVFQTTTTSERYGGDTWFPVEPDDEPVFRF